MRKPLTARSPTVRRRFPWRGADALPLVVVRLRHRGIQLVRAGRADAFVFVINTCRRIERLLQAARAHKRRRPPLRVNLPHFSGNLNLALGADLLHDQGHGKQRREIVGTDRLQGSRVQTGARGLGKSARMLYQTCGIRLCGRLYWIVSMRNILQGRWRTSPSGSALQRRFGKPGDGRWEPAQTISRREGV